MNLSLPFIKRPIATTLLAFGLAFAGFIAFYLLPVAPLPQIDFPTISVSASLPGASPEIMATSVATPLERQFGRIAGITEMTSTSNLGATNVIIQFDLSRNIDGAARDVQAAINAALSQLPPDLPSNPTYRKVNPADPPVLIMALTSATFTTGQMYDVASSILQQKLSQIDGVGQVLVGGSSLPGVRVELNPTALNRYGIGLEDVRTAIATANVNNPKGQLIKGLRTFTISDNDQMFHADQYRPIIIDYQNGNPVKLSDIAEVDDSIEDIRNAGIVNGKPTVALIVFKSPGANIITTVERIRAVLPELRATIPAAVALKITMDRTTTIRASLHDVEFTLLVAIILVILVVYFFLGSVRAALIPTVAVPLSLLGTFGVMYLIGYSLDNLSLMALTISTGFVVDDAVVVLENISRHIDAGMEPFAAAILGTQEVGFTVLSMSTSLVAIFIPILFMGSIVGRLFREFAATLSIAILVSMVVSLTVTPTMCARLLKPKNHDEKNRYPQFFSRLWNRYEKGLQFALGHPKLMLFLTLGTVVLTFILILFVPKGFFPQQDTGRVTASIQADQNISFQSMRQKLAKFVKIVHHDPGVQNVIAVIGGSNNTTNSGRMYITLKPLSERKISADAIINRLRGKLATVPGATLYMQAAQDLVIGGRQSNAQFQYTLSSDNLQTLDLWAPQVLQRLLKLPGIADLNSDQLSNGLQAFVTYDRDTASRFNLSAQLIDNTLYDAFGQRQVSVMYTAMNQYHVVMEVAPQYWQRPETLNNIYVKDPNGQEVPLSVFSNFASSSTLLAVNHQNQFPSATMSFNLLPGVSLGDAVKRITDAVDQMHLPGNIRGAFAGTAQAFQASLANEPYLILAALVVVYIVLGILYESLIHPITILSTLPSASVGAVLALLLTGTELSIIALIGIILLIGIVKKNAIMMIDFALQVERNEKKSARDSIYQAGLMRFRPIMMTTMAAMFGAFPLVFGYGIGSELRRPLGITIVGGLILSQMVTLFTTPVIYLYLERFKNWARKRRKQSFPHHRPSPLVEE
jgi:multidrug efflux pump